MAPRSRFLIGSLIILALAGSSLGFFLGARTKQVSSEAEPNSSDAHVDSIVEERAQPATPRDARRAERTAPPPAERAGTAGDVREAPASDQAGPLGLTPGMTREEYKRHKAERAGEKPMNQGFAEEAIDPRFTAEMQPKVAGFLRRIYADSSVQSVECRGSGCFIEFETTEADGVLGLMEQAEKDLGVSGGGTLGGAPVKGKPGRYSFEALFLFDRG